MFYTVHVYILSYQSQTHAPGASSKRHEVKHPIPNQICWAPCRASQSASFCAMSFMAACLAFSWLLPWSFQYTKSQHPEPPALFLITNRLLPVSMDCDQQGFVVSADLDSCSALCLRRWLRPDGIFSWLDWLGLDGLAWLSLAWAALGGLAGLAWCG